MNDFTINFPFQKINKEKRIVTGIATADNVDQEDDRIGFEGSVDAFAEWIGNIREMHHPKAVGKMVEYRATPVMHKGRVYDGIEVSAYISKGAQDTWEKVLDGTLKGFSIGGRALEKSSVYDADLRKNINYITKYVLGELSLVDNPCNPAGMFTMIKRADDGTLVYEGDNNEQPIYYCYDHRLATIGENKFCTVCSKEMMKIGMAESLNAEVIEKMVKEGGITENMDLHENKNDASITNTMNEFTDEQKDGITSRLAKFLFGKDEEAAVPATTPNVVVNITPDILKSADEKEAVEEVEVVEEVEEIEDQSIEKSEKDEGGNEVSEVNVDELISKLSTVLDDKLSAVKEEIQTEVNEKIDSLQKSVTDVSEKVENQNEEIEKVANSGAEKKSEVIEEVEEEKIEKSIQPESFWGGIFVPAGVAEVLGYDS